MSMPRIVLDTSVVISAMRSNRGAPFRLLSLVGTGRFELDISVPLALESEDAAGRLVADIALTIEDIGTVIDIICGSAHHRKIHYLWRPFLRDPGDDMVLEVAVAAGSDAIVTYDLRHFRDAERFGIRVIKPAQFLREIGEWQ